MDWIVARPRPRPASGIHRYGGSCGASAAARRGSPPVPPGASASSPQCGFTDLLLPEVCLHDPQRVLIPLGRGRAHIVLVACVPQISPVGEAVLLPDHARCFLSFVLGKFRPGLGLGLASEHTVRSPAPTSSGASPTGSSTSTPSPSSWTTMSTLSTSGRARSWPQAATPGRPSWSWAPPSATAPTAPWRPPTSWPASSAP